MTKPYTRERIAAINATVARLAERWPACFAIFEQQRKPLKLGVHLDIAAATGGTIAPKDLTEALHFYTNNIHYLHALKSGATRVDLDGNPAGVVTPEQEATANAKRAARSLRQATKTARQATMTTNKAGPAPATKPKRLTLEDLRAAARQRVASQKRVS